VPGSGAVLRSTARPRRAIRSAGQREHRHASRYRDAAHLAFYGASILRHNLKSAAASHIPQPHCGQTFMVSGAEQGGGVGMKMSNRRATFLTILVALCCVSIFANSLVAEELGRMSESVPPLDGEDSCRKSNKDDKGAFDYCMSLEADGRQWLVEIWSFVASDSRESCFNSVTSYIQAVDCVVAALSNEPLQIVALQRAFPNEAKQEKIVGCWKSHVRADFEQTLCFDTNGSYSATEFVGGHASSWNGEWNLSPSNVLKINDSDSPNQLLNCSVSFSANFQRFARTECTTGNGQHHHFHGVFKKKTNR
jgi:hypothetical protein